MSSNPPEYSDKLALVDASPAAVGAHDKDAWLGLFTEDAEVRDPVGSRPHVGKAAISRFYDTFIAPNDIRFAVEQDVVRGDTVVRDLVIHTVMSTGLEVGVPTHIRYELAETSGGLKIRRLSAHWQLLPMVLQTLRAGGKGLITYLKLSVHMIRCQGMGGVVGFMRGFRGVGSRGRRRAEELLMALSRNNSIAARALLGSSMALSMGDCDAEDVAAIAASTCGMRWSKIIDGGDEITATVHVGDQRGVIWLKFGRRLLVEQGVIYLSQP